jgi:hypothetical protein
MSARTKLNHLHRNQQLPCSVTGCTTRRRRSAAYCHRHEVKARYTGHPLGRSLTKRELAPFRRQMAAFIDQHSEAPQIAAAVQLLDELLEHRHHLRGSPTSGHLLRLKADGLTGREALQVVGSVMLLSYHHPRLLPDDRRLTYALGYELLKARTLPQKFMLSPIRQDQHSIIPGGEPRRVLGEWVRSRLGVFFLRVVEALDQEHHRCVRTAQTLATPFVTPQPARR